MIAALSFLLDFEKIEDGGDTDDSGSEDDPTTPQPQIVLSKEAVYKVGSSFICFLLDPYRVIWPDKLNLRVTG